MFKLNSFFKGSLILLIAINLYNVTNFIFRWAMGRMLELNDFRKLSVIISLIYLMAIFTESIQTIIARYSSIHKEEGKIKNLFKRTVRKSVLISLFAVAVYLIASIYLSPLLKIEYSVMALNSILLFPLFFVPITRGILQGTKRFTGFGSVLLVEGFSKLLLGIILVYFGFRIYGALIAIIIATTFSSLISILFLKKILSSKEEKAQTLKFYSYSVPVFIINGIILIFLSLDVILASIIFTEDIASQYALASLVGQTLFIVTSPISRAMFPISAEESVKKDVKKSSLMKSALVLLSSLLVIGLTIVYFFPNLLINILTGKSSDIASSISFNLGIGFSLLSFTNLVLYHKMSLGTPKKGLFRVYLGIVSLILLTILTSIALIRYSGAVISPVFFSVAFIFIMVLLLVFSLSLIKKDSIQVQ